MAWSFQNPSNLSSESVFLKVTLWWSQRAHFGFFLQLRVDNKSFFLNILSSQRSIMFFLFLRQSFISQQFYFSFFFWFLTSILGPDFVNIVYIDSKLTPLNSSINFGLKSYLQLTYMTISSTFAKTKTKTHTFSYGAVWNSKSCTHTWGENVLFFIALSQRNTEG